MNIKKTVVMSAVMMSAATAMAYTIDWDKIEFWTGDGTNKAALVVQFATENQTNPGALVWGFRWNDGENPTGYDMLEAIARDSKDLVVLTQYTGGMGYTLNGVGFSKENINGLLGSLSYDFDSAADDYHISFGMNEPNTSMGQTSAPGGDAFNLALMAIEEAQDTHVIVHPLNAYDYGYPCYDYDWWQLAETNTDYYWNAGWYKGYWSYWLGGADLDDLGYSGLGMSSVYLEDGDVNGWYYMYLDGDIVSAARRRGVAEGDMHKSAPRKADGWTGATSTWLEPNYTHEIPVAEDTETSEYKNILGSGTSLVGLTLHWGDALALDNLTEGVLVSEGATVLTVIETALAEDSRFYGLRADGKMVGYGFDTNGDNSAAVALSGVLTLENGVATCSGDFSQATGASAYDHWNVNTESSSWKVFVNGNPADYTTTLTAGDNITLAYLEGSAMPEIDYRFMLRPEDQQGVWLLDECVINTADGKIAYFPMIANVGEDVSNLYGVGISAEIFLPDGTAINNAYTAYVANGTKGGMSMRLTVANPIDCLVRPYLNIRKDWGDGKIVAKRIYTDTDSKVSTIVANPLKTVGLDGYQDGDVIELSNMGTEVIVPVYTPANADFTGYSVKFDDESIATIYTNVNAIVAHNAGETTMTLYDKNGNEHASYTIRVAAVDPTNKPSDDYQDGVIWLNEEWFGHTSGSLNYIDENGNIFYRAYGEQNDNMAFGCTSQFGTIYAGKLIVMSKQAWDGGDTRERSGGRVVVVDANTMKYLGSIDEIGGDGRACVGINPSKVYLSTSAGIRVMDLDNYTVADTDIPGTAPSRMGQIGDMVKAGKYVFAVSVSTGLIIIDTTDDTVVETISDTKIQGVVRSKDGRVWYADANLLTPINPETLEVGTPVTIPGAITCSSGSWRHANLMASTTQNVLLWGKGTYNGNDGDLYRWNIDEVEDPSTLQPVFTRTTDFNKAYGYGYATCGYDDRTDTYMFCSMPGFGVSALHNWYHFIDATTGQIKYTVKLPLYWWFPAMPIFPDKYEPVIDMDTIAIDVADAPKTIDLSEFISDPDNHDCAIEISLDSQATTARAAAPAQVSLDGRTLTVTPLAPGDHYITLTAESNGRVASKEIAVQVLDKSSISSVSAEDVVDYQIFDLSGVLITDCRAEKFSEIYGIGLAPGVYLVSGSNGITTKIVVK